MKYAGTVLSTGFVVERSPSEGTRHEDGGDFLGHSTEDYGSVLFVADTEAGAERAASDARARDPEVPKTDIIPVMIISAGEIGSPGADVTGLVGLLQRARARLIELSPIALEPVHASTDKRLIEDLDKAIAVATFVATKTLIDDLDQAGAVAAFIATRGSVDG